jgi:hypothetical protein
VDELTLEPYAVIQHWHLPDADGLWESILGEYLQGIAQHCNSAGKCVIGHIKALSTFSHQRYLRVSVVAANVPATLEGEVPAGCTELELTLNVLVYGLERTAIEQITRETANEIASQRKGVIHHKNMNHAGEHLHLSNHQDQSKGETP